MTLNAQEATGVPWDEVLQQMRVDQVKSALGVCAAETIVFSRPDVIAATAEQDFTSRLTAWCSANHNQLKSGVAHAYDTSASRGYLELERPHAAQVERQTHQAPLTRDFVDPS